MDPRSLHHAAAEAEKKLTAIRAIAADAARTRQDLTSGRYSVGFRDVELDRLRAQTRAQLAEQADGIRQQLAALLAQPAVRRTDALRGARHTPAPRVVDRFGGALPDEQARALRLAGDTVEALAGLRVALTLSRTADDDLAEVFDAAVARNDLALIGELRREVRFRAVERDSAELRLFAGRIDGAIGTLDLPEVIEQERLRRHLEQAAADLDEACRAALDGDTDRGPRWAAARAIDPDAPRSAGGLTFDPDKGHVINPAADAAA